MGRLLYPASLAPSMCVEKTIDGSEGSQNVGYESTSSTAFIGVSGSRVYRHRRFLRLFGSSGSHQKHKSPPWSGLAS